MICVVELNELPVPLLMQIELFIYAGMPNLCKKSGNGFGWPYYHATWKSS